MHTDSLILIRLHCYCSMLLVLNTNMKKKKNKIGSAVIGVVVAIIVFLLILDVFSSLYRFVKPIWRRDKWRKKNDEKLNENRYKNGVFTIYCENWLYVREYCCTVVRDYSCRTRTTWIEATNELNLWLWLDNEFWDVESNLRETVINRKTRERDREGAGERYKIHMHHQ